MTETTAADVTTFNVVFEPYKGLEGRKGYDIIANINGERWMLGFATGTRGFKGYVLSVLCSTENVFGSLRRQADLFSWHDHREGLTLAEVKQRGAVLAGLALAAKTS